MAFLYLKSFHIIFVVTWFAGLFYMVRLFVYYSETEALTEPEKSILRKQYAIMQKRLWYGIAWPSAILTLCLGSSLIWHYGFVPDWLWVKLGFVAVLYTYHFLCHAIFKQQQKGIVRYSSNQLRIFNEASTVLLFAIVFLVVVKQSLSWVYGLLILALLTGSLLSGISIYKKIRTGK